MPKTLLEDEFDTATGGSGTENSNDDRERAKKVVAANIKNNPINCKVCGKSYSSFTNFNMISGGSVTLYFSCRHACSYTLKEVGVRVY